MNKRGQFFILGAIILALALFLLLVKVNTYEKVDLLKDFTDLSNNYKEESVKVVNDAIASNNPNNKPDKAVNEFTENYTLYARSIDPNIGFVYIYWDKDTGEAHVNNYLGDLPIDVYTYNPANPTGVAADSLFGDTTDSLNDLSLDIGGMEFRKTIPVRVKNFDEGASAGAFSGKITLEIGGVFYDIPNSGLNLVARSKQNEEVKIGVL